MSELIMELYDQESNRLTLSFDYTPESFVALKNFAEKLIAESNDVIDSFIGTLPESFAIMANNLRNMYIEFVGKDINHKVFGTLMSKVVNGGNYGLRKEIRRDGTYYVRGDRAPKANTRRKNRTDALRTVQEVIPFPDVTPKFNVPVPVVIPTSGTTPKINTPVPVVIPSPNTTPKLNVPVPIVISPPDVVPKINIPPMISSLQVSTPLNVYPTNSKLVMIPHVGERNIPK